MFHHVEDVKNNGGGDVLMELFSKKKKKKALEVKRMSNRVMSLEFEGVMFHVVFQAGCEPE